MNGSILWLRRSAWRIVPLLTGSTALALISDWRSALAAVGMAGLLLLSGFWLSWRGSRDAVVPTAVLLGVALLLRLLALPLPLALSDDALRYLWDGRVVAAGFNPYTESPSSESLRPLRDELWERLPHRDVETVYPPLALGLFAVASGAPEPMLAWKILLMLGDLGTCIAFLSLARRWQIPSGRTIGYLWNPLVVIEITGMGHVDGLGVLCLVLGALVLAGGRERQPVPGRRRGNALLGSAALSAAVLVKLVPILLLPLWAKLSRRPWVLVAGCGAMLALVGVPVILLTGGIPPGLVTYAVSWEFNGPLFEPLWRGLDAIEAAPAVKRAIRWTQDLSGVGAPLDALYPYVYSKFLAKLLLSGVLLAAVVLSARDGNLGRGTGVLFVGVIAASATVYPWYALWLLPWAVLAGWTPGLILCSSLLLAYVPRFLDVPLYPWVFLAVWAPPAMAWVIARALQDRHRLSR